VLSDGGDNASRTEREAAVRKAQASNAVIYTIALVEPGERGANPELLAELSRASGGEAFRPHSAHDLNELCERHQTVIRNAQGRIGEPRARYIECPEALIRHDARR